MDLLDTAILVGLQVSQQNADNMPMLVIRASD